MIDFLKRKFPNENYSLVFVPRELKNKKKEKKEKYQRRGRKNLMREIHLSHSKADNFNSFLFRLKKKKTETKEKKAHSLFKGLGNYCCRNAKQEGRDGNGRSCWRNCQKKSSDSAVEVICKNLFGRSQVFSLFLFPPSPPLPSSRYLSHFPFFFYFFVLL